uniref:Uncharacterized protein n=1 Tax=Meloidogyne floridensis TaxID=298350 RepID=A0A915PG12_9BILA
MILIKSLSLAIFLMFGLNAIFGMKNSKSKFKNEILHFGIKENVNLDDYYVYLIFEEESDDIFYKNYLKINAFIVNADIRDKRIKVEESLKHAKKQVKKLIKKKKTEKDGKLLADNCLKIKKYLEGYDRMKEVFKNENAENIQLDDLYELIKICTILSKITDWASIMGEEIQKILNHYSSKNNITDEDYEILNTALSALNYSEILKLVPEELDEYYENKEMV